MPAPSSVADELLGMHLCAVQAERRHLGPEMSLFGVVGIAGEPIKAPGSWIIATAAAVRPIDNELCRTFKLQPCSRESLRPGNPGLRAGFSAFFSACEQLYCTVSSDSPLPALVPDLPPNTSPPAPERHSRPFTDERWQRPSTEEMYMLSAFRIDFHSKKTSLGDALYCAFNSGAPRWMVQLLIRGIQALGVGASMHHMIEHCTRAVETIEARAKSVDEDNQRLRRLCAVALMLDRPCTTKRRSETLDDPLAKSQAACHATAPDNVVVRRLLAACRLVKGRSETLRVNMSDTAAEWVRVAPVVGQAILTTSHIGLVTIELVEELLKAASSAGRGHNWSDAMHTAMLRAIETVAAARNDSPAIYLLHKMDDAPSLLLRMHPGVGTQNPTTRASIDDLAQEAQPHLLFLHQTPKAYKVCACVPHRPNAV